MVEGGRGWTVVCCVSDSAAEHGRSVSAGRGRRKAEEREKQGKVQTEREGGCGGVSYAWRRACGTGKLAEEERTGDPSTHLEPARSSLARMTRSHDEPSDHATQGDKGMCQV